MRLCNICNIEKEDSEFYRKNSKRLQSRCSSCFNFYCMERWKARKLFAINLKGGKCVDCGFDKHYSALHFHHLRDKEMSWNKMRLVSEKRFLAELDKCVLLCANCHAIRHYSEDALSN